MARRQSIKGIASDAQRQDARERKAMAKTVEQKAAGKTSGNPTLDSFVNFAQNLGIGADNALSTAGYGFNPITRIRTLLEWIYRGSWVGGVAVDIIADDMTRKGVKILGQLEPKLISKMESEATRLGLWKAISQNTKWSRLYGGSIAVMLIDGQDLATPLRLETVGKGQFKGLYVMDRWMVNPTLNDVVNEMGPDMGVPRMYDVTNASPVMRGQRIHYTRVLRQIGIELPYWQSLMENLWGLSVYERLYDRLVAYDSATTGLAQLFYKSYIRTYKIKGLRQIITSGGAALQGLYKFVDMMRRFQGQEGITLLDAEDEFEGQMNTSGFSGMGDGMEVFSNQVSGALQIPKVRLFGQSPGGLNATGESDFRTYYDAINMQQQQHLFIPVTNMYRAMGQSLGITLPEDFGIEFKTLWELTSEDKADVTQKTTASIVETYETGLISAQTALKELKQSSETLGIFSNITDEDIEQAEDTPAPPAETLMGEGEGVKVPGEPHAPKVESANEEPDDNERNNRAAEHNVPALRNGASGKNVPENQKH